MIRANIINLAKRTDRKSHALAQFAGKAEFTIQLVNAIENENGALGLWQTILQILNTAKENRCKYVLICEDDHQFTDNYSKKQFLKSIANAQALDADILTGA